MLVSSMPPVSKSRTSAISATPSFADAAAFTRAWESVQDALADLPGEEGARRRSASYAPFFLRFGRDVFIAAGCRFYHPQRIALEDDVRFNEGALVYGSGGVRIGRHARIGPRLFLHSANHEIAPSPLAFHERGYDYAPVSIGDNCLLSANVSILPGTSLGVNTFVAAGAVVTGRAYPDDARLVGVPARAVEVEAHETPHRPAPIVAIVARSDDPRGVALERIAATLGLPQIARVEATADLLPESVRSVIDLTGSLRHPQAWTLVDGTPAAPGPTGHALEVEGERFELPATRTIATAPVRGDGPVAEATTRITLYNAFKRLRKRRGEAAEAVDVLIAAAFFARSASASLDPLRERLARFLPPELGGAQVCAAGAGLARLVSELLARSNASAAAKGELAKPIRAQPKPKVIDAAPETLVIAAIGAADDAVAAERWRIAAAECLSRAEKTQTLVAAAVAARILGDKTTVAAAVARLLAPPFLDEVAGAVRTAPGASGYAYSVSLAALLVDHCAAVGITEEIERVKSEPIVLATVERATGPVQVVGRGGCACLTSRRITASLVDAWIAAVRPPRIDQAQFELTEANYAPVAPALERAWRAIFRSMIRAAGEPFVEILPWPNGARAALSLRYDIDRATQAGQVRKIVDIERRRFGGPCGSWYAIPGTEHGVRIAGVLEQHVQELAVHGIAADHPEVRGHGLTMHSAPGSAYWRGESTLVAAARAGAGYAELLSGSLDRPQPLWLDEPVGATFPSVALWVTPLHFPLEGSTNDVDLSYFDRLIEPFRARLRRGGHVIIGSHPDLQQETLATLAEREHLVDCWCAPVGDVVERCRRLLAPGAVTLVHRVGEQAPTLLARATVADVAVAVERPNGDRTITTLQLCAGQPRLIESPA
jgi:acetyltransferase-like isoleucine patch superfamily enzyme